MKSSINLFLLFLLFFLGCSEQKKEFTIWIGGAPNEIAFWEEVINEFEGSSGIFVQLVRQPTYTDQRRQALVISLEAQQPNPDLFLMDVVWIKQFVESGWLQPLDELIEESNFPIDIFFKKIIEQVNKHNDTLYALPVFLDVALLYYRSDLLKKYGYQNPPETWNQLVDYSEKIVQKDDINGFAWQGAQYEGMICSFNEFINSNNGGILVNDKFKINTSKNIEALKFMRDLIWKYNVSPQNTFTDMKEEEVRRNFQSGNAIFERNWTYAWKLHQGSDSPVRGKTGVTILPHFKNGKSVSTLGGWHIGLSKYSDEKKEAWELIKYITSYEVQKKMIMTIGWNPSRKDVYDDPDVKEEIPQVNILKETLENSVARPVLAYYPQLSDVIQRFINNCLAGKMTAEEALNKIQNDAEELVELYGND
jgi:multiple sugar transport system substrate-binding protein